MIITLSRYLFFTAIFAGILWFAIAMPVYADDAPNLRDQITGQITAGAEGGGLGAPRDVRESAASLIQVFLGFLATIFLVLVVMSGYWLVTARGNDQKHEKAMDTLRRAVIGFIVVIIAYGVSLAVGNLVKQAVNKSDDTHECGFFQQFSWSAGSDRCR